VCPLFFHTLSDDDFFSGLGEVVKINFLMGKEGIENIEDNLEALIKRDPETVNRFVESSLRYKKGYIEEDEFDNGVRVYLNFAHTFGHAIETASQYAIPHGTAVAMGMIAANSVSVARGLLSEKTAKRMEQTLRRIIPENAFRVNMDIDMLAKAIRNDKKQTGGDITAVLMDEDAKLSLVHDVTPQEVYLAFTYLERKE
jgi:3-dehydroquinate synthase